MPVNHRAKASFSRAALISALAVTGLMVQASANADPPPAAPLQPGNLLVSTSVFGNDPNIVAGVTQLPPGCTPGNCVTATDSGTYPYVFNNAAVDGHFGVTSKIILDQITPSGLPVSSIEVPNSTMPGVGPGTDQMVTSYSSKSELALNLSTDGKYVTFLGYRAPVYASDVSNGNTPGEVDPTNIDPVAAYRVVGQLGQDGQFHYTETNAYTGDNGRAAILNSQANLLYTAGNAGNGSGPPQAGIVLGAGAQLVTPSVLPEAAQNPGPPTPVGSFNITELPATRTKPDKFAKDDNFRGVGIYNNVLYYTKGSGGNGVDTLYFVDTTGSACPNGVGLPVPGAALPTTPLAYDPATLTTTGLPSNMCILAGLPSNLAKTATMFPFGFWFANPTTLYVADEGAGDNTYSPATNSYTSAAASTTAGLEKWVLDTASGTWKLAYTLQSGLNLGQPYVVPGYPTGNNAATGLPWAPATGGLRNMTGRINPDGSVTIWATSSTVSGSGDQGADPNKLVAITDQVGATTLPASETFTTVQPAVNAKLYRGVSFTPGTPNGPGYWLHATDGGVFSFGSAQFFGSTGGMHLNAPIVGMAATPDAKGYWLVGADGGIFNYGDAGFFGSAGGSPLNKPIVGMAATPDGKGYWLVASDGGIFNYGDAGFFGSAGGSPLNKPIVGMAATPDGKGYWLVASDGGIFTYGDAGFFGSAGGAPLNMPVVGMSATLDGKGYSLVASDGGIFTYGDARFLGSLGSTHLNKPIGGMTAEGT